MHGTVDSFDNALDVRAEVRPLLTSENHDGNLAVCEILLVAQVFIRSQQNIEPGRFGGRE